MMITDIYGDTYKNNDLARRVYDHMRIVTADGYNPPFDIREFIKLCRTHQSLLYPAFEFQRRLRKRIGGIDFWRKIGDRVIEINHQRKPAKMFLQVYIGKAMSSSSHLDKG